MKKERSYLWGLRAFLPAVFTVKKLATNDVRWEVVFLLQIQKLAKLLARFGPRQRETVSSKRPGISYRKNRGTLLDKKTGPVIDEEKFNTGTA